MKATYVSVDQTVKPVLLFASGPSVLYSDTEVVPCDDTDVPTAHVLPPSAPHTHTSVAGSINIAVGAATSVSALITARGCPRPLSVWPHDEKTFPPDATVWP